MNKSSRRTLVFQKLAARFGKKNKKLTKIDYVALAVGLAVFAGVSLATIADSSVWFDEAFSAYLIQFSFAEIWHYTSQDVHPPLYYFLLKLWSMAFGTTELGLRSMSVLFGGMAIFFGYLITRKLFGRKAAIYSLALLAIAPMVIRYSQEMRMYTLVAAIALATTYVLLLATESGKRKLWIWYGVLLAVGMWTHYFAAIVWLAHWAWRALTISSRRLSIKKFMHAFFGKDWIIAHLIAVGLFIAWIPFFVMQLGNVQINGFWIPPVSPTTLVNFLTNSLFYLDQSSVTPWLTLLFIVVVLLLIWIGAKGYKLLSGTQRNGYLLLLCLSFVPPALLIVASMPPLQSSFVDRYLVPSSFAIGMLIAVTAAMASLVVKSRLLRGIVLALVIGSFVVGVSNVYRFGNHNKTTNESSGAKQVVASIDAVAAPGQPIIADSPWVFYDASFYSSSQHPVYFVDKNTEYRYGSLEMLRTQDRNKIKDLAQFANKHELIWVVGRTGESGVKPLEADWQPLQTITQPDPTTGAPAYTATQFKTSAE